MDDIITKNNNENKKLRKWIIFSVFISSLVVTMLGALILGFAVNEIYLLRPIKDAEIVKIIIPTGSSLRQINNILVKEKLISSQLLFEVYVRARNLETSFKAGEFSITRGESMKKIANALTADADDLEKTITLIEGWTDNQIADYLEGQGISKDDFFDLIGRSPSVGNRGSTSEDFTSDYEFLSSKPDGASLEGYLFPDTYRILIDSTPRQALYKILSNFENKTANLRKESKEKNKNFYDVLTMASIIEREVRGETDKRIVSDILWRRLDIGMALQVDSSVNFLTGRDTPSISYDDREIDNPYNTYKYRGLPPGPISNPGLLSIDAALNPTPNQYWFFLTDGEGNVHYARTLDEHNQNRVRYLSR